TMLKRGLSATIEEWLMAAEYIMHAGNPNVILCERGIRTFETPTRNTLDLSAIPLIKRMSHLPIIADPSHGTGHRYLVQPMALAAAAAGADGLTHERLGGGAAGRRTRCSARSLGPRQCARARRQVDLTSGGALQRPRRGPGEHQQLLARGGLRLDARLSARPGCQRRARCAR